MTTGSSSSMATAGSGGSSSRGGPSSDSRSATSTTGASAPVRRSTRRASASTTLGAVSSMPYASSGAVHQPLSPDTMAPRLTVAHHATGYTGTLAAAKPTRSPLPTPCSRASQSAMRAADATVSRNVSVMSGNTRYGSSGHVVPDLSSTARRFG